MSSGPSGPKVDTGNLWRNYSGWLVDNKSNLSGSSSLAKARAAKSGVKGLTVDLVAGQKKTDFDVSLEGIRKGVSGSTLRKNVEDKYPLSRALGRGSTVGSFLYEGRDAPRSPNWVQPRKKYSNPESLGMSVTEYNKYSKIFEDKTGAKPERWEVLFTKKYGFGDEDQVVPQKKTTEDTALTRLLGAKTEDESSTSSPWV